MAGRGRSGSTTTAQGHFGDPVNGTPRVALCLYGDDDVLIGGFVVDKAWQSCVGKPCWTAKGTTGFGYKDKAAASQAPPRSASDPERPAKAAPMRLARTTPPKASSRSRPASSPGSRGTPIRRCKW